MNSNGSTTKGLAELNQHMRHEQKEVRDGVTGDGQVMSEEDESRINEVHPALPRQQQQRQGLQGPVVRWERFLPLRSLKVLLVESDDSTRHVVSALLQNCSYEVMAVSNGLEAWKAMEDLTNHVDLVLTEVSMPCLSGIGLLYKIMNHKTLKNIPVIMMSSNDSMGIVFKCLSKGAVDFLVKPIRKNELKNLWQHVWRRCHSSSGIGSESGIRTQKSMKSGSDEGSDNGSNDEDDDGSVGLNIRGGSDNGSGTQSSWTKRAVDVDSPKPISPWEQSEDPPDSTCARVIHSKPKGISINWLATTATREFQEQEDELEYSVTGKDLEIGVPGNPDLHLEVPTKEILTSIAGTSKDNFTDLASKKDAEELSKEKAELKSETPNGASQREAVNLIDAITDRASLQMESLAMEFPKDFSKITNIKDKDIYGSKDIPSLVLSLKRSRDVADIGTTFQERNVLRHSGPSAFSRYNTTSLANQTPTGNVGGCSPVDNNLEAAKMSNSSGTPNQRFNGSSNNNDMGSTNNNAFNQPEPLANNKAMPKSSVNLHLGCAFQPVKNGHVSSLQPAIPGKPNASRVNTVLEEENVQVQHHHHHYHHHHHHVHNMQKKQLTNHDNCGPSNGLSTKNEANAAISSASGSNNGSNGQNGNSGQNGTSAAVISTEAANLASDNGATGKCGDGGGSGSGSRSGVDQNRLGQREAALDKFRQKRKERCFEKKVRYQSRKKLAEQRPRVRGQFVRKVAHDNNSEGANS